jgi:hypothetical protein
MEVFLGMPGAGARLHSDSVCEPIFSVQLSGRKRWRLSPLPPYQTAMGQTEASSYIAQRSEGAWEPTYDFVLEAGEAVFFPTSWMHETRSLDLEPDDAGDADDGAGAGDSRCSLSLSLQWRYPSPVSFIRDFAPRLLRARETHFCFEHWAPFITGNVDGVRKLAFPVMNAAMEGGQSAQREAEQQMRQRVRKMFATMDVNGDGFVTGPEKVAHFENVRRKETAAGALVEFEPEHEAADWIVFHDEVIAAGELAPDAEEVPAGGDGDGRVSLAEWEGSVARLVDAYVIARQQGAVDVEEEGDDR